MNNRIKINQGSFNFLILMLLSLSTFVLSGEINEDLKAFISDATYQQEGQSGKFQVICYLKFHKHNESHDFATAFFDNKINAVKFYQNIITDWESINRTATPTYNFELIHNKFFNDNPNQVLCVLRNGSNSANALTVPSKNYLSNLPKYKYQFFPSILGYHPRGGYSHYTHLEHLVLGYDYIKKANVYIFNLEYENYYGGD